MQAKPDMWQIRGKPGIRENGTLEKFGIILSHTSAHMSRRFQAQIRSRIKIRNRNHITAHMRSHINAHNYNSIIAHMRSEIKAHIQTHNIRFGGSRTFGKFWGYQRPRKNGTLGKFCRHS